MTNPDEDPNPEDMPRLSDALYGDGFTSWPRTELSDAVIADGLERLQEFLPPVSAEPEPETAEAKKARRAQMRAAQEIRAAHADPHWLDGDADAGEATDE